QLQASMVIGDVTKNPNGGLGVARGVADKVLEAMSAAQSAIDPSVPPNSDNAIDNLRTAQVPAEAAITEAASIEFQLEGSEMALTIMQKLQVEPASEEVGLADICGNLCGHRQKVTGLQAAVEVAITAVERVVDPGGPSIREVSD